MVRREWGAIREWGAVCGASHYPVAIAALLACSGGAWAQSAAPAAPAAPGAAAAGGENAVLEEVVVTAERRSASIQTTPISISAVSGDQLAQQQVNSVHALQTVVPNFTVNDQGGLFEAYNIRGVGNTAITPVITTGIAVFRDGLLLSETIGQNEPLYDIRDVEVLRGPQGTFVGAASTGGAVQINSKDPNFNGVNGYAEAQFGNYSEHRVDGAINLPVSDTLAARLAFNWDSRKSFYRDIGTPVTSFSDESIIDPDHFDARDVRIGLLWKPSDSFQALFKMEYNFIDQGGTGGSPSQDTYQTLFNNGGPGNPLCPVTPYSGGLVMTCPQPGTTTHSQYYAYSTHDPYLLNYYGTNYHYTVGTSRYGLDLRYTLPDGIVVRSLTGYQKFDVHNIFDASLSSANAGDVYQEVGPEDNYYSEELNLISPTGGKLDWIAGAFAYYRRTPVLNSAYGINPPYAAFATPSTVVFFQYAAVARTLAAFGQVNWHMTSTLELQVGVRENFDRLYNTIVPPTAGQPAAGSGVYLYPITPTSAPLAVLGATERVYKDSVPTGKVGLNWTPIPGQYFYVFYARGYKAGGVVINNAPVPPTFQPEHLNDYEVGWKGTLLDGHLQTQLGGYWMDYQDMQYPLFDINNPAAGAATVKNLAPSTLKGIEFSMQSRIGGLGVDLGLSFNKSSLGAIAALPDYRLPAGFGAPVPAPVQCGSAGQTPRAPCFNYLPYEETVGGERNPFSPEVTANISVDYSIPLGVGSLDPRLTYSYLSDQWASIFQDSQFNRLRSRKLLGANLTYLAGPWTVDLYGTNLTNLTYVSGINGGGGGAGDVFYGAPRQFGIRMSRTF
jgi:iron complex outermembrane recepter protein